MGAVGECSLDLREYNGYSKRIRQLPSENKAVLRENTAGILGEYSCALRETAVAMGEY